MYRGRYNFRLGTRMVLAYGIRVWSYPVIVWFSAMLGYGCARAITSQLGYHSCFYAPLVRVDSFLTSCSYLMSLKPYGCGYEGIAAVRPTKAKDSCINRLEQIDRID